MNTSTGAALPHFGRFGFLELRGFISRHGPDAFTMIARAHPDEGVIRLGSFLPGTPMAMVADPTAAMAVLRDSAHAFLRKGPLLRMFRLTIGSESPLVRDSDETQRVGRNAMMRAFDRKALDAFRVTVRTHVELLVQRLEAHIGQTVDLFPLVSDLILGITLDAFFGMTGATPNDHAHMEQFRRAVANNNEFFACALWSFPALLAGYPRFAWSNRVIRRYVDAIVATRRLLPLGESVGPSDIIALLIKEGITDPVVLGAYATTVVIAANETTAATAGHCLLRLAMETAYQDAIAREASMTTTMTGTGTTNAVIWATLATDQPIPFIDRTATEDVVIVDDHGRPTTITKGTAVIIPIAAIHDRARNGVWDPELFRGSQRVRPSGDVLPFSQGPRFCPGMAPALAELRIILEVLLAAYRITLDPAHPPLPHIVGSSMRPAHVKVRIERR